MDAAIVDCQLWSIADYSEWQFRVAFQLAFVLVAYCGDFKPRHSIAVAGYAFLFAGTCMVASVMFWPQVLIALALTRFL